MNGSQPPATRAVAFDPRVFEGVDALVKDYLEKRVKVQEGEIAEYRVRLRLVFDMAPETVLHW